MDTIWQMFGLSMVCCTITEFLQAVLDRIISKAEILSLVQEHDINQLKKLVHFKLPLKLTCNSCGASRSRVDTNIGISFCFVKSVENSVTNFLQPEILHDVYCKMCDQNRTFKKEITTTDELPKVLIVHLKCWSLTGNITVFTLAYFDDIYNYLLMKIPVYRTQMDIKTKIPKKLQLLGSIYTISGTIFHKETSKDSGHYQSNIKSSDEIIK